VKLRNQLLTLSLATLLVPWSGWKLVQELEGFLRAGQESALLASAKTVAQALPSEFQAEMIFGRERVLPLRTLAVQPHIDGYSDDWPAAGKAVEFESADGVLSLQVLAGQYQNQVYLYCTVTDPTRVREGVPTDSADLPQSDGLLLFLRSARGLVSFRVHTAAPGLLNLSSQSEGGGQAEGYWLDNTAGYQVELALPLTPGLADLSLGAVDAEATPAGNLITREAGTLQQQRPARWLILAAPLAGLQAWLAGVIPPGSRGWIVDHRAWVLADANRGDAPPGRQLSWAQRLIYRVVAGSRTEFHEERPGQVVRFDEGLVDIALSGQEAQHWGQDPENAAVRNTVAVPVSLSGRVRGAVILESSSDGLLLVTNRALGRLLLTTLLLTVGLTAGLWFFATRLSRRVQRLSSEVSRAMDDAGHPRELPMTQDRDELGELARNNQKLLRAVSEYTRYLRKLAGRLSHELKTPLAITRSSLDNLATQELDQESQRYVARAREGLDRQAAIVRAMSEANRLEAAVESADWEDVDLAEVIGHCVEAYRSVHAGRDIGLQLPVSSCNWRCAPELVAQALDKLVENALSMTGAEDRVSVTLECDAEACHLKVRNTGTQLPDVLPEQLFDSLVSLRDRGGGRHLGLGLHIVRLVAEAHGGKVTAGNLPERQGVEFVITLPGQKNG
jgi:dedicated sortase system histidine kinase